MEDYAVFQDAQRHTCIRVKRSPKGVDYIPFASEGLEVVRTSHKEFEMQYEHRLRDYPVQKAATTYLGASWVPVSDVAKKHLEYLAAGKFLNDVKPLDFEGKESIMTEEAKKEAEAAKTVAAKPAAKVAAKPAAKVAAKPAAKVAAKPAAKVAAKPAAKVAAKPAAKVAAKPAAKVAAPKTDATVSLKKSDKDETLPPQARVFLETLKANGSKLATSELLKLSAKSLVSKQPPQAVFAFYRKKMVDGGFITIS